MRVVDLTRAQAIPSPYMSDAELEWLAEQATQASMIVEIGCAFGRSTRVLADHCSGVVYAVDPWASAPSADRYAQFQRFLADHLASGRVRVLRMTSAKAALLPLFALDVAPDLVFIDGNHAYDAVLTDIRSWQPLIRSGGLLCGHDYWPTSQPGVKRAVDERFAGQFTRHATSLWAVRC